MSAPDAPRWDVVAGPLTRYMEARTKVGHALGAVATAAGDQNGASLRNDLASVGLDAADPVVAMALVFMLNRFSMLVQMWGPAVLRIDPHIGCCVRALEESLGVLLVDLVPVEGRPA